MQNVVTRPPLEPLQIFHEGFRPPDIEALNTRIKEHKNEYCPVDSPAEQVAWTGNFENFVCSIFHFQIGDPQPLR